MGATHERDAIEAELSVALKAAFDDAAAALPADVSKLDEDADYLATFRKIVGAALQAGLSMAAKHGVHEAQNVDGFIAKAAGAPPAAAVGIDWELVNDAAVAWAEDYANELLDDLTETTVGRIQQAVADWAGSGDPLGDLGDAINDLIADPRRADLIAATEATRAFAEGNVKAWGAQGVEGAKWMTAEDTIVCPTCRDLEGQTFTLDEIEPPPAHPGCRCYLQPVLYMDSEGE